MKIPPPQKNRHSLYDFDSLKEYGDSVYIKTDSSPKVRDAAYKYGKYHGIKLVTRKEAEGVRVYHGGTRD